MLLTRYFPASVKEVGAFEEEVLYEVQNSTILMKVNELEEREFSKGFNDKIVPELSGPSEALFWWGAEIRIRT